MKTKPIASISLDLDNKWSYLKTHGDESWQGFPSYLDSVVPRFLEFLDQRQIKITVFVVGQDAAIESNHQAIQSVAQAGHEIGNHSFHHEPWLHLYSRQELIEELSRSEASIKSLTGQKTIGFRGPGFSISDELLDVLGERGYEYDATIFPTYLGPVARAYYFFRSSLSREQREKRKTLFGRFSDGRRPNQPFAWNLAGSDLIEIPVTTMPIFKIPIHMSYILYLSSFSQKLANYYFWQAIQLCRWFGVEPSILLHPLDFLGKEDEPDLAFFPGMNLARDYKLKIVWQVFETLEHKYTLVNLREHASRARAKSLRSRDVSMVKPAPGQA